MASGHDFEAFSKRGIRAHHPSVGRPGLVAAVAGALLIGAGALVPAPASAGAVGIRLPPEERPQPPPKPDPATIPMCETDAPPAPRIG